MAPRLPPLHDDVRTFADGGASAHVAPHSPEAFALALRLGADGLAGPVRLTADGVAVVTPDGRFGSRLRRRPLERVERSDLPDGVPSLRDLYDLAGGETATLSLLVVDPAALDVVLATVREVGPGAEGGLWLCSPDLDTLASWRELTTARLLHSTRLGAVDGRPERWAALLRDRGVDGCCLPHREWNGGLITLLHRFERLALAREARHERELAAVIDAGIDGVYSAHVDRMAAVALEYFPARANRSG